MEHNAHCYIYRGLLINFSSGCECKNAACDNDKYMIRSWVYVPFGISSDTYRVSVCQPTDVKQINI